jgi:hypothetical protein
MERRTRAAWRTGQRYQQAASLLTLTGALAGALAVLLAVSSAGEIVSYRDRDILVPGGLGWRARDAAAGVGCLADALALRAERWA